MTHENQDSSYPKRLGLYDWVGKGAAAGGAVFCGSQLFYLGHYTYRALDEASRMAMMPQDDLIKGALSFGLSVGFSAAAIGCARLKGKTIDNHNRGVIAQMNGDTALTTEWTPDDPNGGFHSGQKESIAYTPVTRSLSEDFYVASRVLQFLGEALGSSSRSNRSRSSNKNNGNGLAVVVAGVGLAAMVAGSVYVAVQAMRMNFFRDYPDPIANDAVQRQIARIQATPAAQSLKING